MNRSPQPLINALALGLIVLFVGALLAALILPRLLGSAEPGANAMLGATATPTEDMQVITLMYAPDGAVITTEAVGDIPAWTRIKVVGVSTDSEGWLFQIITLDDTQSTTARIHQLMLDPAAYPENGPTPAPRFDDPAFGGECYPLVLTEAIAADAHVDGHPMMLESGTHVRVASTNSRAPVDGYGWIYQYRVVAYPGDVALPDPSDPMAALMLSATVREDQLSPSPGIDVLAGTATPTSPLVLGLDANRYMTTVDLGEKIPQGTRLTILSAAYACDHWVYQIVTEDGVSATLREDQIAYAQGVTPPASTPTLIVVIAHTIGDPTTALYSEPVLDPEFVLDEVPPGTDLTVHGRWQGASNGWYAVFWRPLGTGTRAWVHESQVEIEGNVAGLPPIIVLMSQTPTPTPMHGPVIAYTLKSPTSLRSGHSTVFSEIAQVPEGTALLVLGVYVPDKMFLVRWDDAPNGQAWVSEFDVRIEGDFSTVPLVDPGPVPTLTATP